MDRKFVLRQATNNSATLNQKQKKCPVWIANHQEAIATISLPPKEILDAALRALTKHRAHLFSLYYSNEIWVHSCWKKCSYISYTVYYIVLVPGFEVRIKF